MCACGIFYVILTTKKHQIYLHALLRENTFLHIYMSGMITECELWGRNSVFVNREELYKYMEWERLESKYLVDNEFIKIRQDKVKLPDGALIDDFFVIEKKNVSLIVAIDEEKRIILKDEYRYPIDKHLIELPGGTFDVGETEPLKVAKRELLEETGYSADEWELLFTNYDYPTKEANHVSIYLAKNIKQISGQQLDMGEDIKYNFVHLKEAVSMCMDNTICVNGTVAAILKTARIYGV